MKYQRYNKYKNKKICIDNHIFDSKKESEEYLRLKVLEKQGIIKDLELQKEWLLQDKFKINGKTRRKIVYKSDFSYVSTEDDRLHVIDVKGFRTDLYKLKKKLFEYKYGVEIEEV